jgi:hypothetical protein
MRFPAVAALGAFLLLPLLLSQSRDALESDPGGWRDLLADKTLKGWIRGPLGAAGALRPGRMEDPNPWSLDASGTTIVCEGDRVGHEWLRWGEDLSDFMAHVEWRFPKLQGEPRYNAGVFARTSPDGSIWHQAQATLGGGYLFADTLVNGVIQRVNTRDNMPQNRIKPSVEWNTYEIKAVGDQLTLWVNGGVASEMKCEVRRGFFGLEAEGYRVEYRNVRLKTLP